MWSVPAFLFGIAFFHRAAPGIIAKELMQAFGATGAIVGLLSATYYYAYAGLMLPAGVLLDAFGVRRVVAGGGGLMGLGALAMAVAGTSPLLFGGRFLVGLGASVTFVGALKVAATSFPPGRFATLSALTAAAGPVGALLATAPLAGLVARVGWRGALGLVGLVTLAAAGLCLGVGRDRPGAAAAPPLRTVLAGLGVVVANRSTWPPFLTLGFQIAAASNLWLWVVPCLRDVYGLSTTEAAWYATAPSLAVLGAGPLTGFLSDHVVGRRKLPYTALNLALLVCWVILVLTLGRLPLGGVYALLFTTGVAGAGFVLSWPIGREVNPPGLAGVAVAVVNMGGFVGAALSQTVVGAVLDARWQGVVAAGARVYPVEAYRAAFALCALFALASTVATAFLTETRGRNVWRARLP
jgi:MFS family permease